MTEDQRKRDRDFDPGNTGGWSADDQDAPQPPHASPEKAAREDDDPEKQRRGEALGNRREEVTPEPDPVDVAGKQTANRRGMHPGERGTRGGEGAGSDR